jgi:hypothetical protein
MTNDHQINEYLDEHLPYMLKMVRYAYRQMLRRQFYLSFNAHFESFAVNTRNLVNFLTNNDEGKGNFKACEFVKDFKARKGEIQGVMRKLDQQVFHLDKNRPRDDGKFHTGAAEQVLDWIEENFAKLLHELPPELRRLFNDQLAKPEEDFIVTESVVPSASAAAPTVASFTGFTGSAPPKGAEASAYPTQPPLKSKPGDMPQASLTDRVIVAAGTFRPPTPPSCRSPSSQMAAVQAATTDRAKPHRGRS